MKKLIFAAALCILAACNEAQIEPNEPVFVGPYMVENITSNIYHIQDANEANMPGYNVLEDGSATMNNCSDMYLLVGSTDAALIDLSNPIYKTWDTTAVQALQYLVKERIAERELTVIITHNHPDHVGMMPAFYDSANFWVPADDFTGVEIFPEERTVRFAEGDCFSLSNGLTLKTLTVQGHTKGSTIFHLLGTDIIFSGDAIGSGSGCWIFSYDGFIDYIEGVHKLLEYVGEAEIDKDNLIFYSGHMWQRVGLPEGAELNYQYLADMRSLIDRLIEGKVAPEPYQTFTPILNANFKYGTATITWNSDSAARLAKEYKN